jgi:hypothetical protein
MSLSALDLLTVDEDARLLTLTEYDILHSLREPVFDEFVALATYLFKLPISLIALVGAEEVGYKAALGLPGLTRQARQEAICALVVRQNRAVVFTDLNQVEQQEQLTAAAYANAHRQQLRFYAGIPLCMPDQRAIGTFCIIGRQPRAFGVPELRVLEIMAHLIERLIMVRHACLASNWLGGAPWQLVQGYVMENLHKLIELTHETANASQVTVPSGVLQAAVRQLNELGAVLAEPLPGFV